MNYSTSAPSRLPTSRMGRPSAQQSQEKMEELLRVARRAFVRSGYRRVTMEAIAAEANVSKRTLYAWHKDKAALFLACVMQGARRFPTLSIDPQQDVESGLKAYAAALVRELSLDTSYGMGLLIMREAADFPELAKASEDAQSTYLVEPLAHHLRSHGLERPDALDRTRLLIAMILAEVHAALVSGAPPPPSDLAERQALVAIEVFLRGARPGASDGS